MSLVLAQGPHHWINIPSGSEYKEEFEKKYPGMRSGPVKSDYEKSFPYERLRPAPQKPTSDLLLYSNASIYSNSQINIPRNGNSRFVQNHPNFAKCSN